MERSTGVMIALLLGCGGGASKTVDLTLTMPDGTVRRQSLSDQSGFLYEGTGRATASFPALGTWNKNVPLGVSVGLFPLQPGRYGSSGNLHLGGDTVAVAPRLTLSVTVDRVRWQNSGAFPFRLEGSFTGTSDQNHKVDGTFSTTTDDCSDKVRKNGNSWLCGLPFPDDPPEEQRWTIPAWTTEGTCPDAVVARFGGGGTLVINGAQALMGGQKPLQCQRGYVPENRYVCGGSEENVQADGCTWAVTAFAAPGALTVNQPRVSIIAGTVGSSCEPKLCSATPSGFVHVSGATP